MREEIYMNQEEMQEKQEKRTKLSEQLRCLVALYIGYLGVSLGWDVIQGAVSGQYLWLCGAAAVLFVAFSAVCMVLTLPKLLKKQKPRR